MSKRIDNQQIKLGQMIRVANTQKKFNEKDKYVSIQVQDEDGKNERCLLFTEIELSDIQKVKFPFDMVIGRLYKVEIGNKETFVIKVLNYNDQEMILRISNIELSKAEERAKRNP